MLSSTFMVTAFIVLIALCFDFINGFHDCANAIATSVSTRVLTMGEAVVMSACLNFVGAFISVEVARTIGSDTIKANLIQPKVVAVALIAAIIWDIITWFYGIPSSSSHALIGGLIGSAVVFQKSFSVIYWGSFLKTTVLWLILSPTIGFIAGYIFMTLLNWILRKTKPSAVTKIFSKVQIISAALMALNHGGNDAQKSMGVITLALLTAGYIPKFDVPTWVKIACALAMAFGTTVGGSRIIKTVGSKMAKLAPVNGFAAETGAAIVIFTASMFHAPVSTTHTISTSIMGVSASKRLSNVRWVVAKNIVWAWVLTIPVSAIIAGVLMIIAKLV